MVAIICLHCILFGHFQPGISLGETTFFCPKKTNSGKEKLRSKAPEFIVVLTYHSPSVWYLLRWIWMVAIIRFHCILFGHFQTVLSFLFPRFSLVFFFPSEPLVFALKTFWNNQSGGSRVSVFLHHSNRIYLLWKFPDGELAADWSLCWSDPLFCKTVRPQRARGRRSKLFVSDIFTLFFEHPRLASVRGHCGRLWSSCVRYSAANLPVLVPNLSLFWHPDLACDFCLRDFSYFFMHVNNSYFWSVRPNPKPWKEEETRGKRSYFWITPRSSL